MFEREFHQKNLAVLNCLNADFLANCCAYFGGGTAVSLRHSEHRLSGCIAKESRHTRCSRSNPETLPAKTLRLGVRKILATQPLPELGEKREVANGRMTDRQINIGKANAADSNRSVGDI